MMESTDFESDYRINHWPFKEGIIPTLFPRRKQLLYELRTLREENERLQDRIHGQLEVIDAQSADILALNEKLNSLMNECHKAQRLTQDILRARDEVISAKDTDIAKLERDNRSWQEAAHRMWNTALVGGDHVSHP